MKTESGPPRRREAAHYLLAVPPFLAKLHVLLLRI
jgi:hypothetical protein